MPATYYLPLTADYILLTTYYQPGNGGQRCRRARCLLIATYYLPLTAYRFLLTTYCLPGSGERSSLGYRAATLL